MAGKGLTPMQELQCTVAVTDRLIKGKADEFDEGTMNMLRSLRAKCLDTGKPIAERQGLADEVLKAVMLWGTETTKPKTKAQQKNNGLEVGLYQLGSKLYLVHWNEAGTYKYAEEWNEDQGRFNYQAARAAGVMKDLTPKHKLGAPQVREACRKFPAVNRKLKAVLQADAA